jgi:hydrogenase maturation protease
MTPPRVLVVGIGNWLRGDDAAGLHVARRLIERPFAAGVIVRAHEGEAIALIDLWHEADTVVIADAVRSGATSGTLHRIQAGSQPLPARLRTSSSTHAFGLGETIELARELDRLPHRVVLHGVEGARYETGLALSRDVEAAIGPLTDAIRAEVDALTRPPRPTR